MHMAISRASKGLLSPPRKSANIPAKTRASWLAKAGADFVQPTPANRKIYSVILETLWPAGHGIPGPAMPETSIRAAVNAERKTMGKEPYLDVFRRLRELQGDEGFTCIIKEGTKYQLQGLEVGPKRTPREKPTKALWKSIQTKYGFKCAHCGAQQPPAKLSPDHRRPRSRGGDNDESNWQPLCEQCNNIKSSTCRGCTLNCFVCSWAFPETYKPIVIDDENKEKLRRMAEQKGIHQSALANSILMAHFNMTN